MDDTTFAALTAALRASPDNLELRLVVIKEHLERREPAAAWELVRGLDSGSLIETHRPVAARAALEAGAMEEALALAAGDEGHLLLLQARALLALDRRPEARARYERAVAANPTLEDRDLLARLGAQVRSFPARPGGSGPALTVLSHDDPDPAEVLRLLHPQDEAVTFGQVGGLERVKEEIRKRIILPFTKPSLFERFRRRVGGGILLYGPPGCGKTLLARATAGEVEATFLSVAISDVLDMYIGESERKLHALFEKARDSAPAVLFFDEIEALGGKRQYSRDGTASKLVSQFLSEMDGFAQGNGGVLILAATNVPWAVDPAFRRPGRFDRVLFVPPPDHAARETILGLLLAGRPTEGPIDTGWVAERTAGFSGADLRNLVETAVDEAIEASMALEREVPLSQAHLKKALGGVHPTTGEWLTTARNFARYANEGGQYDEVLQFLEQYARR
jgi:AAA+ superfamily predicted ATPase